MSAQEILEEANLQDAYWGKLIILAETRPGGFTGAEQSEAGNWPTCACGRTTCDIPRHSLQEEGNTGPLDEHLHSLGMEFYNAVCVDDFEMAARTLVEIEKRAIIVAAEYHKENPKILSSNT